jgi:hypothetical protein
MTTDSGRGAEGDDADLLAAALVVLALARDDGAGAGGGELARWRARRLAALGEVRGDRRR